MPIRKDASKEEVFHDFRHGKTYAKTRRKYGKKKANKQLAAVALKHERSRKKAARKRKTSRKINKRGAKR